jgi:hypoxanthine-DNA glycosylase
VSETPHVHGFPPVERQDAKVLILGSMPGKASLAANQYYAHPRNLFWKITSALLDFDPDALYAKRLESLIRHRVALWDVLQACTRESSLDSDIVESSIVPNRFQEFFDSHRDVAAIYFNGARAEQMYRRHVLPEIAAPSRSLYSARLPSTSPAHASLSFAQKLDAWKTVVRTRDENQSN